MVHSQRVGRPNRVGRVIRERRLAAGLTQAEAAARAGVSVGAWRSTESGQRRPRPQTFRAIIDSLGLSPDEVHHASPWAVPFDVQRDRAELVRLCQEDLPDEHVELLLHLVQVVLSSSDGEVVYLD